jgi:hypothetical protein
MAGTTLKESSAKRAGRLPERRSAGKLEERRRKPVSGARRPALRCYKSLFSVTLDKELAAHLKRTLCSYLKWDHSGGASALGRPVPSVSRQ